jgi:hypothetical protein|tara:strand:+ start:2104 stop:2271 length:168 start_codon:yes stop_codon:yes gene_type:complete
MEEKKTSDGVQQNSKKNDPALMESIGTFPVWMLKIIDLITPSFLIKKTPPRKYKP